MGDVTLLFGQSLGILAFIVFTMAMAETQKDKYFALYSISSLIFALHYYFIGALVIFPIAVLAVIRTGLLVTKFGWKIRYWSGTIFGLLGFIITLAVEITPWSILFATTCLGHCLIETLGCMSLLRKSNVIQRLSYLSFYITVFSIGGILSEIVALSGIMYGRMKEKGYAPPIFKKISIKNLIKVK